MNLIKKFLNQTRKPEGLLGKMMINSMNNGHAKLADWGISHLISITPAMILDIGCGGGRNAAKLLATFPSAKQLTAIDFSPLCVEKTKQFNKKFIQLGQCSVQIGDVSDLNFADNSFDLVTAFETIYFWPSLENCFSNVLKILVKGGCFLIVNESDGRDKTSQKFEQIIDGMKSYPVETIEAALKTAGFSSVRTTHHTTKHWITVIGFK